MENFIKQLVPSKMNGYRLKTEEFITMYNEKKVELLDIRMGFEVKAWQMNFGLQIPANDVPDNLDKLPKDKIIVCGCPKSDRSIMTSAYLNSIGIESCYLGEGLFGLMDRLKGGKVKDLDILNDN